METKFVKLKDYIGKEFIVTAVQGYKWKMWLPAESRMHVADQYEEGHRKVWQIETEEGIMDVSSSQLGQMLEASFDAKTAVADLSGAVFTVKSNGKEGMEIRYFINRAWELAPSVDRPASKPTAVKDTVLEDVDEEEVNLSDIPF